MFNSYSVCFSFQAVTVCTSLIETVLKLSVMVGWCSLKGMGAGGRGSSNRQDMCAFLTKRILPSLLHSFTSHPSPHPCHASSLHLKHTPKNETPPSCFIHPLSVFTPPPVPVFHSGGLCLFSPLSLSVCLVCCFLSCIKKLFFLVSVLQSVCLSVFVHVAVSLAVWLQVESGVTQWATSSGGL